MKKIIAIIIAVLAFIIIGILLINVNERDTEVTKERTKVGVLLNGEKLDRSWGQSHYEALEKSASELNLEITYVENTPEDSGCFDAIEKLIADGNKIIIGDSFGFGEQISAAAKKYPDIFFFHAAGTDTGENLTTFFGRMYQMRYLSGIVAGMQTESNEIGYVAAFPISEVNRGINAFTLGVRKVNPNATVFVSFCNSWVGESEAEDSAEKLLADHPDIDIMTVHADSLAALDVADRHNIWSIGYNMDNSELYPDSFLTAPSWQWQKFYTPHILECLQGKFVGENYWDGAETGIVDLSPLTKNVKSGIAEYVESERKRIESGVFDVFYGPITDNNGVLRVADDESMTDDAMLNDFDWYVEGVVTND